MVGRRREEILATPERSKPHARRIVTEATSTSRYVYLKKPVVTLVSDEFLGERFVTVIKVKAYVFDARYENAFASDVTERVLEGFRDNAIKPPAVLHRSA